MKYQIFSGVAVAAGILLVAASPASLAAGLHLSTDNKAVFHVSRSETDGSTDSLLGGFAAQHGTAHVFIKKDGRVLFHMTIIVD